MVGNKPFFFHFFVKNSEVLFDSAKIDFLYSFLHLHSDFMLLFGFKMQSWQKKKKKNQHIPLNLSYFQCILTFVPFKKDAILKLIISCSQH